MISRCKNYMHFSISMHFQNPGTNAESSNCHFKIRSHYCSFFFSFLIFSILKILRWSKSLKTIRATFFPLLSWITLPDIWKSGKMWLSLKSSKLHFLLQFLTILSHLLGHETRHEFWGLLFYHNPKNNCLVSKIFSF